MFRKAFFQRQSVINSVTRNHFRANNKNAAIGRVKIMNHRSYLSTEAPSSSPKEIPNHPRLSIVDHPFVTEETSSLQSVLETSEDENTVDDTEISSSSVDDKFAVIALCGTQYKVGKGDVLNVEKIPSAKVGEIMELSDVLLVGSRARTVVGRPVVPDARVQVRVEEQTLDEKVIVFKMKRRKNYRRKQGHRRQVTMLRVLDIVY